MSPSDPAGDAPQVDSDSAPASDAASGPDLEFRAVAESLPEGLMIADLEGRIRYVNPVLTHMSGYRADELVGQTAYMLSPTDRERRMQERGLARRTRGESDSYEIRLRRKNGSTLWIQVHASPYRDSAGAIVGALAVLIDISQRKQDDEKVRLLQAAVEQATDAIIICTVSGQDPTSWRIAYVNPGFAEMSGYSSAEILGRSPFMLQGPDSTPEQAEHLFKELTAGRPVQGEMVAYRKDRSEFLMEWQVTPMRAEGEDVTHLVAVQRDVSEQRRLENQLRQSQKMEAVGRLAGGVAHDFNNLLTAIIGYNDLMHLRLSADDPQREAVEQIGRAADKAATLTSQLLAFSRRQVLQPKVIDLNSVMTGVETMLRRLIGEDLALETRLSSEAVKVKADPGQLEQVILNLAINARDAMPDGGTLQVTIDHCEVDVEAAGEVDVEPGSFIRMTVRDSGIGMDAETQAKIFEPFFTTKGQEEGTGLGLATVYGIVKQSGGFVSVESALGEGTTFEVHLPRVEHLSVQAIDPAPPNSVTGGEERVLLAEDDEGVRRLVATVLSRKGYEVIGASNGEEALDLAAETSAIDLLISDVVMPDMRGPELARRILIDRPEIRTLFISGYADGTSPRRGEFRAEVGSEVPFLQKPFSPEILARKVREVLDQPSTSAAVLGSPGSRR